MPFYNWDRNQMAEYLMCGLAYEDKVEEQMANQCIDIVADFSGTPFEDDAVMLANLLNRAGEDIYLQLQELDAYTNGYLYYGFRGWCGDDIMLGRLNPQDIPQPA